VARDPSGADGAGIGAVRGCRACPRSGCGVRLRGPADGPDAPAWHRTGVRL